mmetsp:Transcript_10620/g.31952  ORF Transcript_10620/g.31952 Transcript_10620/m.31952 type:complete len:148 (-) Transcript_10620:470-913(-)
MARTAGRAVHVFTAHTEAMMTAALDAPGVDFIITDYPHRLRRMMQERRNTCANGAIGGSTPDCLAAQARCMTLATNQRPLWWRVPTAASDASQPAGWLAFALLIGRLAPAFHFKASSSSSTCDCMHTALDGWTDCNPSKSVVLPLSP